MTIKRQTLQVALLLAAVASSAHAESRITWHETGGHVCRGINYTDAIHQVDYGSENRSTWEREVMCPIQLTQDSDLVLSGQTRLSEVVVQYFDREPRSGKNVRCRPVLFEQGGGITEGPVLQSEGFDPNWVREFVFAAPFGDLDIRRKIHNLYVRCTLPTPYTYGASGIAQLKAVLTFLR